MEERKISKVSVLLKIGAVCATLVIAIYLISSMITNNPLEDSWHDEEKNVTIVFRNDKTATISCAGEQSKEKVSMEFTYEMDKSAKTVNLTLADDTSSQYSNTTGAVLDKRTPEENIRSMEAEFEYSVQRDKLTLTERDFGDSIEFVRIK